MTRYIARRLLASIPALLGITLVTFLLMHATAGSFLPGLELNPNLRPEDIQRIRQNLGLDEPLPVQYWRWLTGLVRGDFGSSILNGRPVLGAILERLPNTLLLTGTALVIGVGLSVPFGIIGAVRRGWTDNLLTFLSVIGVSLPAFWLGLLLILVFSITFNRLGWPWLPSGGATSAVGGGDVCPQPIGSAMSRPEMSAKRGGMNMARGARSRQRWRPTVAPAGWSPKR